MQARVTLRRDMQRLGSLVQAGGGMPGTAGGYGYSDDDESVGVMPDSGGSSRCARRYQQCGGSSVYSGPTCCADNSECARINEWCASKGRQCRAHGAEIRGVTASFRCWF